MVDLHLRELSILIFIFVLTRLYFKAENKGLKHILGNPSMRTVIVISITVIFITELLVS